MTHAPPQKVSQNTRKRQPQWGPVDIRSPQSGQRKPLRLSTYSDKSVTAAVLVAKVGGIRAVTTSPGNPGNPGMHENLHQGAPSSSRNSRSSHRLPKASTTGGDDGGRRRAGEHFDFSMPQPATHVQREARWP